MKNTKFKVGGLIGKTFGRRFFWNIEAIFKAKNAILSGCKNDEEFENAGRSDADFLLNLDLINKNYRALDIGCGIGRIEQHLSDYVNEIHGVDISGIMIKKARKYAKKTNVFFHVNDGSDLKMFPGDYFDIAFSFYVFQHFSRNIAVAYVKEIERVLKSEGKFLCQFQYKNENESIEDPGDKHPWGIRLYSEKDIQLLAKTGDLKVLRFVDLEDAKEKRSKGIDHDKCNVFAIMGK